MIKAVIIDSREPENIKNIKFEGVPTTVSPLDRGDLMAICDDGCTIVVERKTPDDLLNSLRDDRLMPQLAKMSLEREKQLLDINSPTNTYWPYLVISGSMYPDANGTVVTPRGVTKWQWASIQGVLATIQELGVTVIYCNGDEDYSACIMRIGNRERRKNYTILPPKTANVLDHRSAFIAGLPGIGVERILPIMAWANNNPAHALLGLTDLTIESPATVNQRQKIRSFIGLQENENLEIICNEA